MKQLKRDLRSQFLVLGGGVNMSKFNFLRTFFSADPSPPPLTVGPKGQNSTFSEECHVAYQIKGNHKCSKMVANSFSADPLTPDPGVGVKRSNSFF